MCVHPSKKHNRDLTLAHLQYTHNTCPRIRFTYYGWYTVIDILKWIPLLQRKENGMRIVEVQ